VAGSHPSVITAAVAAATPLLVASDKRIIIGVAGPPAAGKSTLATALARELSSEYGPEFAVAAGMDGFHLANAELNRLGFAAVKGAPETFDAYGFIALLKRLRRADEPIVYAPTYSRSLHESIGSAVPIGSHVRVVVVEGNYLLLPKPPWAEVRTLLDLALYLDAPSPARVDALVRRQRSKGLDPKSAHEWVHRSDEVNAALIATTKSHADVVLVRPS
jgi:pantothenate kinase